jgi:hypothetical protein
MGTMICKAVSDEAIRQRLKSASVYSGASARRAICLFSLGIPLANHDSCAYGAGNTVKRIRGRDRELSSGSGQRNDAAVGG